MTNLVLFVVTTLVYWFVYEIYINYPINKKILQRLGITVLLCLPLNINGNVFTVLGNVDSQGVKNIYSVLSLYQSAENDAYSLLGSLYQKAGRNAATMCVASAYQEAGHDAVVGIGASGYQNAGQDAIVFLGASVRQASGRSSTIVVGVSGIQDAKDVSSTLVGINLIQRGKIVGVGLGLSIYQHGLESADTYISMALYQRAGDRVRNFAVWSQLEVEAQENNQKPQEKRTGGTKG